MFMLSMAPGYSIHYSGAENKDDLPPSQKQFWRWSQRFTDNPHLKQKTGVQDIELVQHIHHQYEGNTEVLRNAEEVRLNTYIMHIYNVCYHCLSS